MTIFKIAAAVVIAGGIAAFGTGAAASEPATSINCLKMSKQVKDALYTHQAGAAHDAAERELKTGNDYCMRGYYKGGMEHLQTALKTLGGSATAAN
jgi:hypothetical protein